jgi:hypothetical protein
MDRLDEALMLGPAAADELLARRLEGSERQWRCKEIYRLESRSSVAAYAKTANRAHEHTER